MALDPIVWRRGGRVGATDGHERDVVGERCLVQGRGWRACFLVALAAVAANRGDTGAGHALNRVYMGRAGSIGAGDGANHYRFSGINQRAANEGGEPIVSAVDTHRHGTNQVVFIICASSGINRRGCVVDVPGDEREQD